MRHFTGLSLNQRIARFTIHSTDTSASVNIMAAMFAARIASLTLAMISVESTIELLNKMRIVPSFGTCSTCRDTKLAFFSRSFINLRVAFSFLPLPKRCKKRDHSSTKQMSVGDQGVMIMIGRATTCKKKKSQTY